MLRMPLTHLPTALRWVRMLATAKPADVGTLYRCKAVLAQLGSTQRLAFHAVSDVTEQEDVTIRALGMPLDEDFADFVAEATRDVQEALRRLRGRDAKDPAARY